MNQLGEGGAALYVREIITSSKAPLRKALPKSEGGTYLIGDVSQGWKLSPHEEERAEYGDGCYPFGRWW